MQCTVGAVSISCLLCTKFNIVDTCDHLEDVFITFTSGITTLSACLKSTLNPFLYRWKISEVRQAVKQTIRQVLCCPGR